MSEREQRGARWRGAAWAAAAVAGCAGLALWGVHEQAGASPSAEASGSKLADRARWAVRVAPVEPGPSSVRRWLGGQVRAEDAAAVAFVLGGRVEARPVDVGDRVEAGDVLARLDTEAVRIGMASSGAQQAQARAQLSQARRDVARAEQLVAAGAAGAEEVEQLRSRVRVLQAAVAQASSGTREARRLRTETTLKAPLSGVVSRVGAREGEVVSGGQPVVWVEADRAVLEVEVGLPEGWLGTVKVGDAVRVRYPLAGVEEGAGEVVSVSRVAERGMGGLYPMRVRLVGPSPRVAPGMTAQVGVDVASPGRWTVPVGAVVDPEGVGPRVFVVRDGVARRVNVALAGWVGQRLAVEGEALGEGVEVVVAGHVGVRDGADVEVRR